MNLIELGCNTADSPFLLVGFDSFADRPVVDLCLCAGSFDELCSFAGSFVWVCLFAGSFVGVCSSQP